MKESWQKLYYNKKLKNDSVFGNPKMHLDSMNRYQAISSLGEQCPWYLQFTFFCYFSVIYGRHFHPKTREMKGVPQLYGSQYNIFTRFSHSPSKMLTFSYLILDLKGRRMSVCMHAYRRKVLLCYGKIACCIDSTR